MTIPTNLHDLIALVRAANEETDRMRKERDELKKQNELLERELNKLRGRLAAVAAMKGEQP